MGSKFMNSLRAEEVISSHSPASSASAAENHVSSRISFAIVASSLPRRTRTCRSMSVSRASAFFCLGLVAFPLSPVK